MQQAATQAQEVASKRVRKIEADAKRVLEKLVDRAEQELRAFLAHASEPTQHQWGAPGERVGSRPDDRPSPPRRSRRAEVKSADAGGLEAKN